MILPKFKSTPNQTNPTNFSWVDNVVELSRTHNVLYQTTNSTCIDSLAHEYLKKLEKSNLNLNIKDVNVSERLFDFEFLDNNKNFFLDIVPVCNISKPFNQVNNATKNLKNLWVVSQTLCHNPQTQSPESYKIQTFSSILSKLLSIHDTYLEMLPQERDLYANFNNIALKNQNSNSIKEADRIARKASIVTPSLTRLDQSGRTNFRRHHRRNNRRLQIASTNNTPFVLHDDLFPTINLEKVYAQELKYINQDEENISSTNAENLIESILNGEIPIAYVSAFDKNSAQFNSLVQTLQDIDKISKNFSMLKSNYTENNLANPENLIIATDEQFQKTSESYIAQRAHNSSYDPNQELEPDEVVVFIPRNVQRYNPPLNLLGIGPNVAPENKAIYRYITRQSKGPVTTEYARDVFDRTRAIEVGAAKSFLQGALSATQRGFDFSGGWRTFIGSVNYNEIQQRVASAFVFGNYGVHFDRSNVRQASALEILARGIQFGSLLDSVDRNLGTRLRVRNFEISISHDFDDYFNVVDGGFGTQLLVKWYGVSFAVANDIREKRLAVAVGVRNHNLAILHDFDQFSTVAQYNWGRGWQLAVEWDFPDEFLTSSFISIGMGKLNRAFVQVGAGVGDDGVGQATARLQGRLVGIGADFLNEFNKRVLQLSFTIGRLTYVWESNLNLENIKIPNFLGIEAGAVEQLLLSLLPSNRQ